MKSTRSKSVLWTAGPLALSLLTLAACSLPLPQAQSDPTKFYVLSAPGAGASAAVPTNAPAIRLRPIELASYLRARPIVIRRGENELEFRDFARWGEPLEQGIARVLREELLARGAVSAVQGGGTRAGGSAEVSAELSVRVLACEGTAEGGVDFRAVWELTSTSEQAAVIGRGEYRATNISWKPKNEATLAAALSRAVAGLAGDIAAGIARKSDAGNPDAKKN